MANVCVGKSGDGGTGGGSSPGEMTLGLSFVSEEKSHRIVCKN